LPYRAARMLLTNVGRHAKATTVWVGLMGKGDRIVSTNRRRRSRLRSCDRGAVRRRRHIGLCSPLARFDAMSSAMEINSRIGYDTPGDCDVAAGAGRLFRRVRRRC
jgi:two-component system, NarL family, sensor kinase